MADIDSARKTCSRCLEVKPASLQFFGFRKEGALSLKSVCKSCLSRAARERRKVDPAFAARHVDAVKRAYAKRASIDPAFVEQQKAQLAKRKKRLRADPEKRERELEKDRAWRKANWDRVKKYKHKCGALQAAHVARRHAAKLKATPAWSEAQQIKALYEAARKLTIESGVEHNVDHIVPLRGRKVCGLHVFANLRIVTAFENKTKANKLIEVLCTA